MQNLIKQTGEKHGYLATIEKQFPPVMEASTLPWKRNSDPSPVKYLLAQRRSMSSRIYERALPLVLITSS
jgi:hypothetical protein